MQLLFATIDSLDQNENQKSIHIIHNLWHLTIDNFFVVFAITNVVHKWLDNMLCLVQLVLPFYIIVATIHVPMASKCTQYDMLVEVA
jgi:hypothetical protein